MSILQYLRALYPTGTPGLFAIGDKKRPLFFRSDQLDEAAAYARAVDTGLYVAGSGTVQETPKDVYSTVALYSDARRLQKQAVAGSVLWLDVDRRAPGHAAQNLPETIEDLVTILRELPIEPSFVTDTGGGWHVYFKVISGRDKPSIDLTNRETWIKFRAASKALQEKAKAAAAAHGWHLDVLADLARFLRPTGTHNRKPGRDSEGAPEVRFLIEPEEGPTYVFDEIRPLLGPAPTPKPIFPTLAPTPTATPDPTGAAAADPATDPNAEIHLTPDATKELVRSKVARNRIHERGPILTAVLDGLPFAGRGERDSTAQRLASWLCFYTGGLGDIDAVVELVEPSLQAMADESPDDHITVEVFRDKVSRAMGDALRICREGRALEARLLAGFKAGFEKRFPSKAIPADQIQHHTRPAAEAAEGNGALGSAPRAAAASVGASAPAGRAPDGPGGCEAGVIVAQGIPDVFRRAKIR